MADIRGPARTTLAIFAAALGLTSLVLYTPLLSDWITRNMQAARVQTSLAGALAQLYAPPAANQLLEVERPYPYDLANGCVGDTQTIVYGINLPLPAVIVDYNQSMAVAGWKAEALAQPLTDYAIYDLGDQTELYIGTIDAVDPDINVSTLDHQRYDTLYAVRLEYFLPAENCRT